MDRKPGRNKVGLPWSLQDDIPASICSKFLAFKNRERGGREGELL
jgi:hypothetical protein